MLATSRMWRSTRSMPAVSWRPLRAGAPAGEQRLGRFIPLQATFPRGRLLLVHTLSSRPIRRWPCLIRSGPAAAEPVAVAEVVAAEAVGVGGGVAAEAGVEVAARAVVVRAEAAARAAVAVRAEAVARAAAPGAEERAAPEAVAPVVAVINLSPIILTIRPTTSRGRLFRHFHLRLRPTSRFWLRWRRERAASRFSIPTTC